MDLKTILGTRPSDAQREELLAAVKYVPSIEQREFHFAKDVDGNPYRIKLAAGGERAGKSLSAEKELFSQHLWGDLFWIVGPDYEQSRQEFRYLVEDLQAIGNLDGQPSMPLQGGWSLRTVSGAEIVTKSAKEPATLAGRAPDGILMVEAGQSSYEAFLRCSGRIAEKRGWLCVNGTFEGSTGWYPQKWREWKTDNNLDGARSFSLPTWSNLMLFPGGKNDPEILRLKASFPDDKFQERYGGVPVKPSGLVYSELTYTNHVRLMSFAGVPDRENFVLNPHLGVRLWIDPGYAGYDVLFALVDGPKVYIFDEIFTNKQLGEDVIEMAVNHPQWRYVNRLVMDIAATQHHGSESQAETWHKATGLRPKMEKYKVVDEINRVRTKLHVNPIDGEPNLYISPKCTRLLKEMTELYRYPTDDMGMAIRDIPIPKENHACTALSYGLLDEFGVVSKLTKRGAIARVKSSLERMNVR